MCVAKDINLSTDLLQDQSITTSQLIEYVSIHPEFYEEIAAVLYLDPLVGLGVEPDKNDETERTDDLEVSLAVVNKSLGLDMVLEGNNHLEIAHSTAVTL